VSHFLRPRLNSPTQTPLSNWTRYPLPESDFRTSVAAMCSSSTTAAAGDLRFLPLLFVVLAIAARLAPERLCGDVKSRRLTSQRYYWSCKCLCLSPCFSLFTRNISTSVASCGGRHTTELSRDDLDPAIGKSEEPSADRLLILEPQQSARFLTFDRRITECWSQLGAAVSTAQSLGLHRDASVMVGCGSLIHEWL